MPAWPRPPFRLRAKRRWGELAGEPEHGGQALGPDGEKKQLERARKLAAVPAETFEAALALTEARLAEGSATEPCFSSAERRVGSPVAALDPSPRDPDVGIDPLLADNYGPPASSVPVVSAVDSDLVVVALDPHATVDPPLADPPTRRRRIVVGRTGSWRLVLNVFQSYEVSGRARQPSVRLAGDSQQGCKRCGDNEGGLQGCLSSISARAAMAAGWHVAGGAGSDKWALC